MPDNYQGPDRRRGDLQQQILEELRGHGIALVRIEEQGKTVFARLDKHSSQIAEHETNLNGDKDTEGLNEWRRNFNKRHALISGIVPTVILIAYETIRYRITGRW
jgi:hypothetical protein